MRCCAQSINYMLVDWRTKLGYDTGVGWLFYRGGGVGAFAAGDDWERGGEKSSK